MRQFPRPIQETMAVFGRLPGVGPKTALRYAYALLNMSEHDRRRFADATINLRNIRECSSCHMHTETEVCEICRNPERDNSVLCVLAHSRDIATIEASNAFKGKYFILGGVINPVDGSTPDTLNTEELLKKIESSPDIKEIILAFSPDMHGETTILYLSRRLKDFGKKISRLARGLPMGAELEYADEVTLGDALLGRKEL